jgi:hypothetical protein
MNYLKELSKAVERLHGCKAKYVETVSVTEVFQGQVIWQGDVEVFSIRNHPKAKRCYAWAHLMGENDERKRYVAVLEIPPVDSPQTAVRAAIVDEFRKKKEKS